jgi:dipeptidyl aminopeptidase/acylaminoacyl peptidase
MKHGTIPLEELASLPNFYFPTLSWGRDKVAFYWDKTGRMELYVMDLSDREPKQVSRGEVPRALRAGFTWDRGDERIVFAKDRDGDEQHDLWQISTRDGSVEQLTSDSSCQEYPVEFSPDNRWLTVLSNKHGQLNLYKYRWGADGLEEIRLTDYPNPVFQGGLWSPDGGLIAYCVNESSDLNNIDIYVIRADGSGARRVLRVKEGSQDLVAAWSPDGRYLAFTSDAGGDNRPGLVEVGSGEVTWLGGEGVDESAVRFSPDGSQLVCLRNRESQIEPVLYDVATGGRRELSLAPGLSYWPAFVDDGKLLFTHASPTRRQELLLYDLERDHVEVLLPAEYGSIDPGVFVDCEHLYYESFDGLKIPALLYRPRDISPAEKLPAIVVVHGGPTWQWFRGFDPFAQFLADRGYVVLQPNIRGSTGYGVKFRDLNRMDWGGGDLEDVAHGARFLQSLPYVDPERLGIFGGSYGGYMTFMASVKKPELWKAAVAWVGITHLRKLYDADMEHFKYYFRMQMGYPDENATLWEERSPINYADRLRAKLLMVHGVNDPRCPVEQSRIFRDKLLELGRKEGEDFEYVEFTDEGHGSTDIQHKIRTYKLLADFMDRHL